MSPAPRRFRILLENPYGNPSAFVDPDTLITGR